MRRNAKCCYGVPPVTCGAPAAGTFKQKPYCKKHIEIVERIRDNVEKHKELLDRLKEADVDGGTDASSRGSTVPTE